jgi:hypothetical protein
MTPTTTTTPWTEEVPLPGGFRDLEAARWAHVLSSMGVTCDPEDDPPCYQLLPSFGDQDGIVFYCGPYTQPTWPPCFIVSACALVASGQCHTVVLLGDIAAEQPDISLIRRPRAGYWWLRSPFAHEAGLRLGFRRCGRSRYVPVLAPASGEETVIGPELERGFYSTVPCTEAGVARLLAEARKMLVPAAKQDSRGAL